MDKRRAAERRARESQLEREQRLALGRQRAAERRALESEKEREYRLGQNRKRLALKRASEVEGLSLPTVDTAQLTATREQQAIFNCEEAEQTFQEVEQVTQVLPVNDPEVKVEMASGSSGSQQQPTAEQKTSSGGGEKSGEVKQEIVEITEYRAGTCIHNHVVFLIEAHLSYNSPVEPNLERHYNELLKVIAEIGRDVKPAYTNNKVSTDRLRKSKWSIRVTCHSLSYNGSLCPSLKTSCWLEE